MWYTHTHTHTHTHTLPWWLRWYRICLQCKKPRFDPWVRKIPWRRKWQPTPVSLPGKSHGQWSLVGCSPWGRKESGTTEWIILLILSIQCLQTPLPRNSRDFSHLWYPKLNSMSSLQATPPAKFSLPVMFLSPVTRSETWHSGFIYLFLAVLGLCCCTRAFFSCYEWARAPLRGSALVSHCGGFSCCRA